LEKKPAIFQDIKNNKNYFKKNKTQEKEIIEKENMPQVYKSTKAIMRLKKKKD
jgi:hypothetical protein